MSYKYQLSNGLILKVNKLQKILSFDVVTINKKFVFLFNLYLHLYFFILFYYFFKFQFNVPLLKAEINERIE